MIVKPITSLRGGWIDQRYDTKSIGFMIDDQYDQGEYQSSSIINSWCLGPRFGLDTTWNICGRFRIFLDGAASILYTKYTKLKTDSEVQYEDPDLADDIQEFRTKKDNCFLKPQAELTLGTGWGDWFFCNKWYFDIELGYTLSIYWDQNMFPFILVADDAVIYLNRTGNLSFHGLTVRARVDF